MKLDALVDWYETLTPETIHRLREIYCEDARFRDPFNDVYGHEAIKGIFQHMFKATKEPSFRIKETQKGGQTAWVSWTFNFGIRGEVLSIDGVTRLVFGHDGRVVDHRDYWDPTELYEVLPFVRGIVRLIKRIFISPALRHLVQNRKI